MQGRHSGHGRPLHGMEERTDPHHPAETLNPCPLQGGRRRRWCQQQRGLSGVPPGSAAVPHGARRLAVAQPPTQRGGCAWAVGRGSAAGVLPLLPAAIPASWLVSGLAFLACPCSQPNWAQPPPPPSLPAWPPVQLLDSIIFSTGSYYGCTSPTGGALRSSEFGVVAAAAPAGHPQATVSAPAACAQTLAPAPAHRPFAGAAPLLQPADSLPQPGPQRAPSLPLPASGTSSGDGAGDGAAGTALLSVPITSTAEYEQLSDSLKERYHQVLQGSDAFCCAALCMLPWEVRAYAALGAAFFPSLCM